MADDDWDLQAVVRGCTANSSASCSTSITTTTTATTINNNSSFSTGLINSCIFPQQQDDYFHRMQDLYSRNGGDSVDLFDLYKPFYRKSSPPLSPQSIIPISPLSDLGLQDLSHHQNHQMFKQKQNLSAAAGGGAGGLSRSSKSSNASSSSSHTQKYSRGKKRKNQLKKVIEIPADALSSDMWSWRKYGQKPIKGSPYPRGYYRCSTSKGCLARKQVERSRSDPGMFIVTYTSEHNHPMPTHRNSLAGSSRQKPASSGEPSKQSGTRSSPPVSPLSVSLSPEDGDENMSMMNLEDDFFDGLEEIAGINNLAGISNGFSQTIQFPWLTNNATTTAAGGI